MKIFAVFFEIQIVMLVVLLASGYLPMAPSPTPAVSKSTYTPDPTQKEFDDQVRACANEVRSFGSHCIIDNIKISLASEKDKQ